MPIYEYECEACGRFEVMQKITEPPLKQCEKCKSPVQKLVSQSSFALKGGGWYKDLYSSSGSSNGKSTSKSAESKSSSSSSSGSASSTAAPAKAESKSAAA